MKTKEELLKELDYKDFTNSVGVRIKDVKVFRLYYSPYKEFYVEIMIKNNDIYHFKVGSMKPITEQLDIDLLQIGLDILNKNLKKLNSEE